MLKLMLSKTSPSSYGNNGCTCSRGDQEKDSGLSILPIPAIYLVTFQYKYGSLVRLTQRMDTEYSLTKTIQTVSVKGGRAAYTLCLNRVFGMVKQALIAGANLFLPMVLRQEGTYRSPKGNPC